MFFPEISRFFSGGEFWINQDYENRSQLRGGDIYVLTNEIAPRMHGEI
jgi:hypothetical protein